MNRSSASRSRRRRLSRRSDGGGRSPRAPAPRWTLTSTRATVTLTTAKLRVTVSIAPTARSPSPTRRGRRSSRKRAGGHRLTPANVQGESTFHVQQLWQANDDESLYGLGQRQEGKLDIKGYDLDLWQRNTVVARAVPRLEPRLRHALGQHVVHEVRRHPAVRADSRDDLVDVHDAAPACAGGRADPRAGHRRLPVPDLLQRRHQGLARRRAAASITGSRTGRPSTTSSRCGSRPASAIRSRSRTAGGDTLRLGVEDAAADAGHVALVGGRRGDRLLLRLRPGARSGHRRLSHADRPGVDAAATGRSASGSRRTSTTRRTKC